MRILMVIISQALITALMIGAVGEFYKGNTGGGGFVLAVTIVFAFVAHAEFSKKGWTS